jgi:NADP-dependent 3-hydroxy acid dehydrogenase YdfG
MNAPKKKLALVTGSSAGIGFACARKLIEQNFEVIINGRTQERVDRAIHELVMSGAGLTQFLCCRLSVAIAESKSAFFGNL